MCSTKQRLAAVLREQRRICGLTLRQAAERATLAPSTLSRWESGTCLPRVPELESLLQALGAQKRDIVRILASLDAPRAAKAVRLSHIDQIGEPLAPSGGMLLRSLRRKSGLTITQVADHLGVAISTVSRWESSTARPGPSLAKALMDFLGASQDERECFDLSGVAKIKAERGGLDHERYSRELEEIESKIALGVSEGVELRLLQLLSMFWWAAQEDQGQDLLRRTHGVYAELLVRDGRYADAEDQAHAVIETSADIYDCPGVRAHLVIAQVETHRGLIPRPHLGLLTLQRCLREVSNERSRALILRDMAELSQIAGRHEEAVGYAQRALDSAGRLGDAAILNSVQAVAMQLGVSAPGPAFSASA